MARPLTPTSRTTAAVRSPNRRRGRKPRNGESAGALLSEQILHLVDEAARLRRLPLRRRVALQQLALLVAERGGDLHVDVHVVVAAAGALQELHALAAQAEDLIRLRAGGDAQRLR